MAVPRSRASIRRAKPVAKKSARPRWMRTAPSSFPAVTVRLARVVAHTAVHGGKRVIRHQPIPCFLEPSRLCQCEPGLDILACGAGGVAWREAVDVDRPLHAHRTGPLPASKVLQPWRCLAGRRSYVFKPLVAL